MIEQIYKIISSIKYLTFEISFSYIVIYIFNYLTILYVIPENKLYIM